jgi:hypothetical protein
MVGQAKGDKCLLWKDVEREEGGGEVTGRAGPGGGKSWKATGGIWKSGRKGWVWVHIGGSRTGKHDCCQYIHDRAWERSVSPL